MFLMWSIVISMFLRNVQMPKDRFFFNIMHRHCPNAVVECLFQCGNLFSCRFFFPFSGFDMYTSFLWNMQSNLANSTVKEIFAFYRMLINANLDILVDSSVQMCVCVCICGNYEETSYRFLFHCALILLVLLCSSVPLPPPLSLLLWTPFSLDLCLWLGSVGWIIMINIRYSNR